MEKQKSIKALNLIFWGAIVCVLDLSINNFDILNDFIGMLMITWGVFKLSQFQINEKYSLLLKLVFASAIIESIKTLWTYFTFESNTALTILNSLTSIYMLISMILFCNTMLIFCNFHKLTKSIQKWEKTRLLFFLIYLIPLGALELLSAFISLTNQTLNSDFGLGPVALLLIPVFLAPIVYGLGATNSMKKEIKSI